MKQANGKVIIAAKCSSGTQIYHTDDECIHLADSRRGALRLVQPETITDDWRECSTCAKGYPSNETEDHDHSHYNAIVEAATEDGQA